MIDGVMAGYSSKASNENYGAEALGAVALGAQPARPPSQAVVLLEECLAVWAARLLIIKWAKARIQREVKQAQADFLLDLKCQ